MIWELIVVSDGNPLIVTLNPSKFFPGMEETDILIFEEEVVESLFKIRSKVSVSSNGFVNDKTVPYLISESRLLFSGI